MIAASLSATAAHINPSYSPGGLTSLPPNGISIRSLIALTFRANRCAQQANTDHGTWTPVATGCVYVMQ